MEPGYVGLAIAFIGALAATIGFALLGRREDRRLFQIAKTGVYAQSILLLYSTAVLLYYLIIKDFSVEYVAMYTEKSLSLFYTLSALWAGASGSLLLWSLILAFFILAILLKERKDDLTYYALSILSSIQVFFLLILLVVTDPFRRVDFMPDDGVGLNPLLRNPLMWFHPPTLFIGYAGLAIPFAYAIAGLITERDSWIFRIRKWTLFSWLFLSLGIYIGGKWSYLVLGWGGYWAWDPVENSSLIPWLLSTALLHSAMIQESRRGMKMWNVLLSITTFEAIIFATFLTRSGVISSVHAFGQSSTGYVFVTYMGITTFFSLAVIAYKHDALISRDIFESFLSRETSFLVNNLLFVVAGATIFWGTIFPLINEAVQGVKITVGPEFYNEIVGPIIISLAVLMGVCVVLSWRATSLREVAYRIRKPIVVAVLITLLLYLAGYTNPLSLIGFFAFGFAATSHIQEYLRDVRLHSKAGRAAVVSSAFKVVMNRRRRYGGYIVHLAMLIIFLGIVGSFFYDVTYPVTLKQGQPTKVEDYWIVFTNWHNTVTAEKRVLSINLEIRDSNSHTPLKVVTPQVIYYPKFEANIVKVGILSLPLEDIYVIPDGVEGDVASVRVRFVPFINLIWIGGVIMVVGVLIGLLPKRRELR